MKTSGEYTPKFKSGTVGQERVTPAAAPAGTNTQGPEQAVGESRQHTIHGSPRQTAQRKRIRQKFGQPVQKRINRTGMPDEVKAGMEKNFDADFSSVRVHAGSSQAEEVGALAYTQGDDVHFAPGHYQPSTARGKELLGHELTHVVQQREGRVDITGEIGGMPVNDDPTLEEEADEMGAKYSR